MEPTPARTFDEVHATQGMLECTRARFGLTPKRLAADTAYGTGKFLGWLVEQIAPHIPVWDKSTREDGTFSRSDFAFGPEQDQYTCPAGKLLKQYRRNFAAAPRQRARRHQEVRCRSAGLPCLRPQRAMLSQYAVTCSAACTRTPAIGREVSPTRHSSRDHATKGRRSRCCSRT